MDIEILKGVLLYNLTTYFMYRNILFKIKHRHALFKIVTSTCII